MELGERAASWFLGGMDAPGGSQLPAAVCIPVLVSNLKDCAIMIN